MKLGVFNCIVFGDGPQSGSSKTEGKAVLFIYIVKVLIKR